MANILFVTYLLFWRVQPANLLEVTDLLGENRAGEQTTDGGERHVANLQYWDSLLNELYWYL